MSKRDYKYIYGPVSSWRLGSSLGIDPLSSEEKICSFDCLYCQLGKTKIFTDERRTYVSIPNVIEELDSLPPLEIDYITFSSRGEPTLAENIGRMIRAIKEIRRNKIAVITNSSLLDKKYVRDDLQAADFVIAKLDASSQSMFEHINRPMEKIKLENVISALKTFRKEYKGELALQIMFIEENKAFASKIAEIAREINPDQVQINTPLRSCGVKPLSESDLNNIESHFEGLKVVSVYNAQKKEVCPVSREDALKRRGKM
ncbi:MAG: radical SAM protein [Candidatus Omnitrophica bacterium]|nr:radical SAM protein [Candidatus Omnitrophota bacterium]